MFHCDLGGILDLVDVEFVEGGHSGGCHGAGASDLRLASAFSAGDTGVCADHIADKPGNSKRIQDFFLRETAVFVHVVHY